MEQVGSLSVSLKTLKMEERAQKLQLQRLKKLEGSCASSNSPTKLLLVGQGTVASTNVPSGSPSRIAAQDCSAAKRSFFEAEKEAAKAQKLALAASKHASSRLNKAEAQRLATRQSKKAAEALAKALSARKLMCSTESLSPEKDCAALKRSFFKAEKEAVKAQKLADAASKQARLHKKDPQTQRRAALQSEKAAAALRKALFVQKSLC